MSDVSDKNYDDLCHAMRTSVVGGFMDGLDEISKLPGTERDKTSAFIQAGLIGAICSIYSVTNDVDKSEINKIIMNAMPSLLEVSKEIDLDLFIDGAAKH